MKGSLGKDKSPSNQIRVAQKATRMHLKQYLPCVITNYKLKYIQTETQTQIQIQYPIQIKNTNTKVMGG